MSRWGATMLVVTANWAIADGSVCAPPPRGLVHRFIADARRAAVRAGFRSDGRYRPIERVVIVLAGDTFDGLVSDRWLGAVRPWERRREAASVHAEVFSGAWKHACRPLAAVAGLARRGIAVPSAGAHGRPVPSVRVTVPVHVAMLAGDRDAAVERLAQGVPQGRLRIRVGNDWDDDVARVMHGAACDPLAAGDTAPTILESLAVDLLARFGAALVARPALGERGRRLVRTLAGCHALDMPTRLRRALPTEIGDAGEITWMVDAWRRAVDRWAREARRCGCAPDIGAVDAIAGWMHALEPADRLRPAARETMLALATPLPFAAGHALIVAGHPAPSTGSVGAHVVCLGPATVHPLSAPESGFCRAGAVSCLEAGPPVGPTSPPAVAVFEAGEGGGRRVEWLTACGGGEAGPTHPGTVSILDAA